MLSAEKAQMQAETDQSKRLRISVAMCSYNSAAYLDEQLVSILKQSRLPDELVVCDDGSKDDTVAKLEAFARSASFPVRIFRNEANLGFTRNFEKAMSLCEGDVIALSDHDDIWEDFRLARTEDVFLRRPAVGLVFGDALVIDQNSALTGARLWDASKFSRLQRAWFRTGKATEALLNHNVVTGATMAMRADFRPMVFPIPRMWVHDGWIALVISFFAEIEAIEEPLIRYRQHPRQQVGLPRGFLHRVAGGGEQRSILEAQIRQFEAVHARLSEQVQSGRQKKSLEKLRRKIEHFKRRAQRPDNRLFRLPMVVRELASLRYRFYSRGWKSAIWDLMV